MIPRNRGSPTPMSDLTHFDEHGASRMVDTSAKPETLREARASGLVRMQPATLALIQGRSVAKGDVFEVARLAGIMAAKRTGELIPLCHPLPITSAAVEFSWPAPDLLRIEATVRVFGRTGVEMEALTAVSVASLTGYDMCKAGAPGAPRWGGVSATMAASGGDPRGSFWAREPAAG